MSFVPAYGQLVSSAIEFDHLVYGVPDLLVGVRQFAAATGVEPAVGGRHAGLGTANYLVRLGAAAYLEIIGPDPEAPDALPPYLFGVDTLQRPALLTWCARTKDLDGCLAVARNRGYDPGDAIEMSRQTGTGELLRWRLTPNTINNAGGTVPFLIDWGQSTHPAVNEMPELDLAAFTVHSPDPERIGRQLKALGFPVVVDYAPRSGVRAVLGTPNGTVSLG